MATCLRCQSGNRSVGGAPQGARKYRHVSTSSRLRVRVVLHSSLLLYKGVLQRFWTSPRRYTPLLCPLQWRSPTASAPALRCWVAPPHSSPAGQFCMHLPALNAKLFAGLLLLGFAAWQLRRPLQRRLKSQPQRRGLSPRRRQHSWNSCRPRWVKPSHTRQQRALSLCLPLR
jgi:hypothetical protein